MIGVHVPPLSTDTSFLSRSQSITRLQSLNSSITLVTGLFSIGRLDRSIDTYLDYLKATLELNAPFVIYTQPQLEREIRKIANSEKATIITAELTEMPHYKHLALLQRILNSPYFVAKMQDSFRIETSLAEYTIVQFLKTLFLEHCSAINPYNSQKFVWLDAGISRFFEDFDLSQKLTGNQISNSSYFIGLFKDAFNDPAVIAKDLETIQWSSVSYFPGGVQGGIREQVVQMNQLMSEYWTSMIRKGIVNNDQIAHLFLWLQDSKRYQTIILDQKWKLVPLLSHLV